MCVVSFNQLVETKLELEVVTVLCVRSLIMSIMLCDSSVMSPALLISICLHPHRRFLKLLSSDGLFNVKAETLIQLHFKIHLHM